MRQGCSLTVQTAVSDLGMYLSLPSSSPACTGPRRFGSANALVIVLVLLCSALGRGLPSHGLSLQASSTLQQLVCLAMINNGA